MAKDPNKTGWHAIFGKEPTQKDYALSNPIGQPRPTTLNVLMGTASLWAERSTCDRLHVGAVVAQDGRIVATGYNGAPTGVKHCDHKCNCADLINEGSADNHERGCPAGEPCWISVHAEANAIAFAAKHGLPLDRCGIYTTHAPCFNCALLIKSAGIVHVIYDKPFRDMSGIEFLTKNGVACGAFKRGPSEDMIER